MILIADDFNGVYVWVDDDGQVISAHFDYEEDALKWQEQEASSEQHK